MFQDEARITGELQHANIAQVYDFGQQGNEPWQWVPPN